MFQHAHTWRWPWTRLGVDALGNAVVAWDRYDGTDSRIQVSTGP